MSGFIENDKDNRLYYNNITSLKLQSYEFEVHYAEELDSKVAEFPHQHPLYEIYYGLEDTAYIFVENEKISLGKHELLLISRNIKHQVLYEPERHFKYLVLVFDLFPLNATSLKGPDGVNEWNDVKHILDQVDTTGFLHSTNPFDGHFLLDPIRVEQKRKQLAWNTLSCFMYYQFTIKALRHFSKTRPSDEKMAGKLNLGLEASKFIHKHYAENITLEDVAEYLNISTRHVNREYLNMFNTTFIKNLNLVRLEYAARFLCTTDHSNERIAEMVGFSSARTLYKLFKEYKGKTISQYRKEHSRS